MTAQAMSGKAEALFTLGAVTMATTRSKLLLGLWRANAEAWPGAGPSDEGRLAALLLRDVLTTLDRQLFRHGREARTAILHLSGRLYADTMHGLRARRAAARSRVPVQESNSLIAYHGAAKATAAKVTDPAARGPYL